MTEFREWEKRIKNKPYSKVSLTQPNKQTPQDVHSLHWISCQEKRNEVQKRLQSQLDQLKREIEECECESKREKKNKRNTNQAAITKLDSDIKNHNDHIHNLELILRQLDNDLIDPYKLDEVLDAVDDYLASYKQPNFYYDTTMYDKFCLFSGIPKFVSNSPCEVNGSAEGSIRCELRFERGASFSESLD